MIYGALTAAIDIVGARRAGVTETAVLLLLLSTSFCLFRSTKKYDAKQIQQESDRK